MLMTLKESADKWCPMVRIARREMILPYGNPDSAMNIEVVAGCNTDAFGRTRVPSSCRCVADQCAMWRWGEPAPEPRDAESWYPEDDYPEEEPSRPAKVPENAVWTPLSGEGNEIEGGYWEENPETLRAENERAVAGRRGYCGLAGRAEITE